MRNVRALSVLVLAMTGGLTGCFSTTRAVLRTQAPPPDTYKTESVEQVEKDVSARDGAIKTLNAQVLVTASTGGAKQGEVKEYTSFRGYIFVQKPADLRVILQLPLIGSSALDMVSNGETFTMKRLTSHGGNVWVQGSDKVTKPSKNGLENLRPAVFLNSLLVPGVGANESVTLTESSRVVQEDKHHKTAVTEPDYDLGILKPAGGNVLQLERVVRINRETMLPFEQEIYGKDGEVVTRTTYEDYQSYGGQQFPSIIKIGRPVDEYSLKIEVTKLTLNGTFEADQFEMKIPAGVTVQRLQ